MVHNGLLPILLNIPAETSCKRCTQIVMQRGTVCEYDSCHPGGTSIRRVRQPFGT